MIKSNYNLENKDKEILAFVRRYCLKFRSCDGCIFDTPDGCGCVAQEVRERICRKTGLTNQQINEQVDVYIQRNKISLQ